MQFHQFMFVTFTELWDLSIDTLCCLNVTSSSKMQTTTIAWQLCQSKCKQIEKMIMLINVGLFWSSCNSSSFLFVIMIDLWNLNIGTFCCLNITSTSKCKQLQMPFYNNVCLWFPSAFNYAKFHFCMLLYGKYDLARTTKLFHIVPLKSTLEAFWIW